MHTLAFPHGDLGPAFLPGDVEGQPRSPAPAMPSHPLPCVEHRLGVRCYLLLPPGATSVVHPDTHGGLLGEPSSRAAST